MSLPIINELTRLMAATQPEWALYDDAIKERVAAIVDDAPELGQAEKLKLLRVLRRSSNWDAVAGGA